MTTSGTANSKVILESGRRLSQSLLWALQRRFFEQRGVTAWSRGTVPHYVSTNPALAAAYARMVLGWLRDWRRQPGGNGMAILDDRQPVYLIELGAGAGRFAYHFLRSFVPLWRQSVLKDVPVKYVLTDYHEGPLRFWRRHPRLRPYVEAGVLDFACFDAEHDEEIRLRDSGAVLEEGTVRNPLAVIANYVFDSIPHDAFAVIDGNLHECRVSVTAPEPDVDLDETGLIERVGLEFEHRPFEGSYYGVLDWDRVLLGYERTLDNTVVTFPVGGLRCLERLQSISGGRMLLLSGDKGHDRAEELRGRGVPTLARHGSFSLMVNYHALGEVVRARGGEHLRPPQPHAHLAVSAFLLGEPPDGYTETRQAFEENYSRGGPDEFYTLKKGVETIFSFLNLEQLLAYLRLSQWDANVFWRCSEELLQRAKTAPPPERREVFWAARQVWDNYFPIGEEEDVAASLGELMQAIGAHPAAVEYYRHSLRLHGPSATSYCGLARSYLALWQLEQASGCAAEALQLSPNFGPARALRIEVAECLRREEAISGALDLLSGEPAPKNGTRVVGRGSVASPSEALTK